MMLVLKYLLDSLSLDVMDTEINFPRPMVSVLTLEKLRI